MVQIFKPAKTAESALLEGLSSSLPGSTRDIFKMLGDAQQLSQEDKAFEEMGYPEMKGVKDPALRRLLLEKAKAKELEETKVKVREQEELKKKQETEERNRIAAKGYNNEPLTADEWQKLSPQERRDIEKFRADKMKLSPFMEKELNLVQDAYLKGSQQLQNLDSLTKQAENLRGFGGYLKGKIGTESAAQFDSEGVAAIEPILKMFNPTGQIPQTKLQFVTARFAPKASDLYTTQKGKIRALDTLARQGQQRAKMRMRMIQEYGGNPPIEVLEQYDAESSELMDLLSNELAKTVDQEAKEKEEPEIEVSDEVIATFPDPVSSKGRTIETKEGVRFRSDGTQWKRL